MMNLIVLPVLSVFGQFFCGGILAFAIRADAGAIYNGLRVDIIRICLV